MRRLPPSSTLCPFTTLFDQQEEEEEEEEEEEDERGTGRGGGGAGGGEKRGRAHVFTPDPQGGRTPSPG